MSLSGSGFSLVKYDTPILVSKSFGRTKGGQQIQSASTTSSEGADGNFNSSKAEDYLNSILPPREYSDSGQLWV